MYLWAGIAGACYLVLAFLSRGEQGNLLQRMGGYLYRKLSGRTAGAGMPFASRGARQDLERLHPGGSGKDLEREYCAEKIGLVLVILLGGILLGLAAELAAGREAAQEGVLLRRQPGEGSRRVKLEASLDTGERETFRLELSERELTYEEAGALEKSMAGELEELVRGDNPSLEQVWTDLSLPSWVEGYPFELEWSSSDYETVSRQGKVNGEKGENFVELTVKVTYGEYEWKHFLPVHVVPAPAKGQEGLREALEQALLEAEARGREQESVALPGEVAGRRVAWREAREHRGLTVVLLSLAAAGAVYLLKDRDLHRKTRERALAMKRAYPSLLTKLTLYLGAGMTVRGAFTRIAAGYQDRGSRAGPGPLGEEMRCACNELQAGISESLVYERFGRRTGLPEYARLCALLNQNLKKGNSALLVRLREEGEKANQENMHLRRKLGEEAQTKLLGPMVMLLAMVMILVMLPAFSSFGV